MQVRRIVFSLLFLFVLSGTSVAQEPSTLVLGLHRGAKSYVSLQVLKAAYGRLGIEAVGKLEPEGRSLADSTEGYLDGEVHRIEGTERDFPELIRIPVPINKHEGVAFAYRNDIAVEGWESLEGYRVGRLIGIVFAENGLQNMSNVTALPDINKLFDLLVAGRLDVVVYVRDGLVSQQKRLQDEQLHIIEPPLIVEPLYHYLHTNHKALVPRITRVLQQMQADGEIKRIQEQAERDYWNKSS